MAGRPPRILLFPDANFLAHVSRLLEIGKVLRDGHGATVAFAGEGAYLALARDEGFATFPCFTVPRERTLALARRAALMDPFWWRRVVLRSIRSDVEVIARERPDVVVGDMHWSLRAAAAECAVPYVSVVNAAWTNHLDHRMAALDGHLLTRLLGRRLATAVFPAFKEAALWFWAFPYKMWRLRHRGAGLAAGNLFDVVEGDRTLLADVPEFAPTRPLPAHARYVGPVLWQPRTAAPPWLPGLAPGRPTVYVTMGSTGDRRLFETALRAFAGTEYQLLMTTAGITLPGVDRPPHVWVTDYAPGAALMARADVCVNHGGNGTIYQALAAGVPVVGVPTHADQQLQLQLCERAGVGRGLPERALTPSALRAAVDAVRAGGRYGENARRLAAAIARYDGARAAARAVMELAAPAVRARAAG
jgi:UDP:flavonoid glycosyltransferase YjiC (YdhE family)